MSDWFPFLPFVTLLTLVAVLCALYLYTVSRERKRPQPPVDPHRWNEQDAATCAVLSSHAETPYKGWRAIIEYAQMRADSIHPDEEKTVTQRVVSRYRTRKLTDV